MCTLYILLLLTLVTSKRQHTKTGCQSNKSDRNHPFIIFYMSGANLILNFECKIRGLENELISHTGFISAIM